MWQELACRRHPYALDMRGFANCKQGIPRFIVFLYCLLITQVECKMYSAFTCPGHGWPVNNTNLVSRGHEFQHWLMAVQSDCARLSLYTEDAPHNGITSSINYAIKHFVTAHELGAIYRPRGVHPQWEWAHSDPAKCTLGIKGVDCFFQPLSLCGYESAVGAELYTKVSVEEIDAVYLKWTKAKRDVCGTARAFKVAVHMFETIRVY